MDKPAKRLTRDESENSEFESISEWKFRDSNSELSLSSQARRGHWFHVLYLFLHWARFIALSILLLPYTWLIVSYFAQLNLRVLLLFEHLKNLRLLNTRNAMHTLNNAMHTLCDAILSQLAGLSWLPQRCSGNSVKNCYRKGSVNWKILSRRAKHQTRHREKHLMQTKKRSLMRCTYMIVQRTPLYLPVHCTYNLLH